MVQKYKIEPLEGAQPYYAKQFPNPKVHEETLKTEVNRLINMRKKSSTEILKLFLPRCNPYKSQRDD